MQVIGGTDYFTLTRVRSNLWVLHAEPEDAEDPDEYFLLTRAQLQDLRAQFDDALKEALPRCTNLSPSACAPRPTPTTPA